MNLDKVQEEWQKDSELHRDLPELLANESLETSRLHSKYIAYYNQFRMMLTECETKLHKMKLEKWQYYSGKAPAEVYEEEPFPYKVREKDAIQRHMDADEKLTKIDMKIRYYDVTLKFLEEIIRNISGRTYQIKNAIEWQKFQAGF